MAETHRSQEEILRDEFLKKNDGDINDALLAACQALLRMSTDLDAARHSSSAGFNRSFKSPD